jgi:hypothetical protein
MIRRLRSHTRGQREEGAALALALAFFVLFFVLIGVVFSFASSSFLQSNTMVSQRNAAYAVNGGMDAAIRLAQNDTTNKVIGSVSDPNCKADGTSGAFLTQTINGTQVSVKCTAATGSGQTIGTTSSPGFAILTLAPFGGTGTSGGCSDRPNVEAGIVQPKAANLVTVVGDVYVNSGIDTSQYVGGCPQESNTTDHINVVGNALVREGCADLVILQPFPPVTPAYKATCPIASNPPAALTDPGITNAADWSLPFTTPPPVQAVPSCGASPLVTFTPGTYNDVTAFNTLMGGGCPNHLFWFQPGAYYFDFTNSGTHEWAVNDPTARVVGGQANAINVSSTTVGPTTWTPGTASSANFTTPNNALVIDGTTTDANLANGATARITISNFSTTPASTIPADAKITSVRLRVAHGEDTPALVQNPTVTITPPTGVACAAVPITPRATVGEDAAPSYDVTSCLNSPSKINSTGLSVAYAVTHCTGVANGCTTATTPVRLDGISLDVTYTTGTRQSWDPNNTATITATSPTVPGACRHDGDVGWTDGVQFVFGGDSRVNLRSGAFELCDVPSTTHQEIVMYGVKAPPATSVGPNTWRPTIATPTGTWTNANNSLAVDGNSATTSFTGTTGSTRRLTLSSYTTASGQIPANGTITAATLRVAHSESSTSRITGRTVTVTPGGASACTALSVNGSTSLATQTFDALASGCLNTPAKINGFSAQYSTTYACSSGCSGNTTSNLDGIELDVTYTVPGSGTLDGNSGCLLKAPYYVASDHSPDPTACALFKIDSVTGQSPRIAVFWGTVYTPTSALDIPVDITTTPVFNRGVVARMLMLGFNSTTSSNTPISTTPLSGSFSDRRMTLVATVTSGGRAATATADVEICDYTPNPCNNGTAKIWSWKVDR